MRRTKTRIIFLLAGLTGWGASFVWAGTFNGATNEINPAAVNEGGRSDLSSLSNNLNSGLGPVGISTFSSTNYILRSGLMASIAQPGKIENLTASAPWVSTATLTWTVPGYNGNEGALQSGTSYYIQSATYSYYSWNFETAQVVLSTSGITAGTTVSYVASSLDPNTTNYFRLWIKDGQGNLSEISNSTVTVTLANPPVSSSFTGVFYSSVSVAWTLPAGGSNGFRVEASTASDFTGTISFSSTSNASATTLTVVSLNSGTTYYFRPGSLNWINVANFDATISTTTLAQEIGLVLSTTSINLGSVIMNTQVVITTSSIVTSQGNVNQTYSIKAATITVGSPWTITPSQGTDQFVMWTVFNSTEPSPSNFQNEDKLSGSFTQATSAVFSMGNETGVDVPPGETRTLWLQLGTPLITGTSVQQQIQVTVTASPP